MSLNSIIIIILILLSSNAKSQTIENPNSSKLLSLKYATDSIESLTLQIQEAFTEIKHSPLTLDYEKFQIWKNTVLKIENLIEKANVFEIQFEKFLEDNPGEMDPKYKVAYIELIKICVYKERNLLYNPLIYFAYYHRNDLTNFHDKISNWEFEEKKAKEKVKNYLNRLSPDEQNYEYRAISLIYQNLYNESNVANMKIFVDNLNEAKISKDIQTRFTNYIYSWMTYFNMRNHQLDDFKEGLSKIKTAEIPLSVSVWAKSANTSYSKKTNEGFENTIPELNFSEEIPIDKFNLKIHDQEPFPEDKKYFQLIKKSDFNLTLVDEIIKRYERNWIRLVEVESEPGKKFSKYSDNDIISSFDQIESAYFLDGISTFKRKIRDDQIRLYRTRFDTIFDIFNEFIFLNKSVSTLILKNSGDCRNLRYIRLNINLGLKYIQINKSQFIITFFDNFKANDNPIDISTRQEIEKLIQNSELDNEIEVDLNALELSEPDHPQAKLAKAYAIAFSNDTREGVEKINKILESISNPIKIGNKDLKNLIREAKLFLYLRSSNYTSFKEDLELIPKSDSYTTWKALIHQNELYKNAINTKNKYMPFYVEAIPFIPFVPNEFPLAFICKPPIYISDNLMLENSKKFKPLKIGVSNLFDKAVGKNKDLCKAIQNSIFQILTDSQRFEIIDIDELLSYERIVFAKDYFQYLKNDSLSKDTSFIYFKSKYALQLPDEYQKKISELYKYTDIYITGNLNSILQNQNPTLPKKASCEFKIWTPNHQAKLLKIETPLNCKLDLSYSVKPSEELPIITSNELNKLYTRIQQTFPNPDIYSNAKILSRSENTITVSSGKNMNIHVGDMGSIIKPLEADFSASKLRINFIVTEVNENSCEAQFLIDEKDPIEGFIKKSIKPGELIWFR